MIEALGFDMDGVIVDSEPVIVGVEQGVCQKHGLTVPSSEWRHFKGRTSEAIFGYIVGQYAAQTMNPEELVAEMVEDKRRLYIELAPKHLQAVPGALNFLEKARRKVKKLSLTTMSSTPIQEAVFRIFGLDGLFDVVVNGSQVRNSKPHPESYLRTFKLLGVVPEFVIEDSDNGILSVVTAGGKAIGITTSFPPEVLTVAGASHVVDSYQQLEKLLF